MYKDFIPERLAKLRTQKGISARDMSQSLGKANNYINNIESKKALPSTRAFFDICAYLEVTPQQFFGGESAYPEYLLPLVEDLKRLDAAALTHLSELVKDLIRSR